MKDERKLNNERKKLSAQTAKAGASELKANTSCIFLFTFVYETLNVFIQKLSTDQSNFDIVWGLIFHKSEVEVWMYQKHNFTIKIINY